MHSRLPWQYTAAPRLHIPEFGEINARNGFNRKLMPETLLEEKLILKTRRRREKFWVRRVNTQYVLSASLMKIIVISFNENHDDNADGVVFGG